ncbi:osmosensitive K+ channel His-kinase sensor [Legionella feeleii]|uniref:Osmosensitive K+ channel His-kinase sensor n=1 Tax=Legionella feeleii TaxID=453 RepID=A0A2X1QNL3_9GAMM|nr:osmosensitive K+ channel His-kinase sensor [Legionella feeleii]
MVDSRPNPEQLLRRAQKEEKQGNRGKLKIYWELHLELARLIKCFRMLMKNVVRISMLS